MASGAPSRMLALHDSFPTIASAGIKTSATGTQANLFTRPRYDFRRFAASLIAGSVADLHAPKHRHAQHDQGFLRFIRIHRPGVTRRIRKSSKDALAPCRDVPGFRNAQLDAAKD